MLSTGCSAHCEQALGSAIEEHELHATCSAHAIEPLLQQHNVLLPCLAAYRACFV